MLNSNIVTNLLSGMTQIDSTAQTDLGISDHEELLLPYKVIVCLPYIR